MPVYEVEPLKDRARWSELLREHPMSSVFHTHGWLEALSVTYGYEVRALTTTKPGQPLKNGLPFCRVKSWLTGSRNVSLPFSDHCQPLVDSSEDLAELVGAMQEDAALRKSKYCELRPVAELGDNSIVRLGLARSAAYCFHILDLRRSEGELYRGFHKSCIQRKVQRAEREGLTLQEGRSERELAMFYDLLLLTRRRHQLPPQPLTWFGNLSKSFGDGLQIRVALKDRRPIASILTLEHKKSVVYKYGCSDSKFHNLGGMPFLFWSAIRSAKERGAEEFDFGRSETDNPGLISFKDNWGGARRELVYYRHPSPPKPSRRNPQSDAARKTLWLVPDFCLKLAGSLMYRHIG